MKFSTLLSLTKGQWCGQRIIAYVMTSSSIPCDLDTVYMGIIISIQRYQHPQQVYVWWTKQHWKPRELLWCQLCYHWWPRWLSWGAANGDKIGILITLDCQRDEFCTVPRIVITLQFAHCCVLLWLCIRWFSHILQGCFMHTGAIIRLRMNTSTTSTKTNTTTPKQGTPCVLFWCGCIHFYWLLLTAVPFWAWL